MKKGLKFAFAAIAMALACTTLLAGCDLTRKLSGAEVNFQKKIESAQEFSFKLTLTVTESDGATKNAELNCYKSGNEYAYTLSQKNGRVYRRLYADNKMYEFETSSDDSLISVGTYSVKDNVPVTHEDNVLYWVSNNIMAAGYAVLVTKSKTETIDGKTAYRYDFTYGGDEYSLWYDDENMIQTKATFHFEEGDESYLAKFTDYKFENIDKAPFTRPEDMSGFNIGTISLGDWSGVVGRFSGQAISNWLQGE